MKTGYTHHLTSSSEIHCENPVKRRLREGETAISLTLTAASPEVAAAAARLGFDFLWIEMEHSPITLETLRNMVLAVRGLPAVLCARVPVNEIWQAKRVLDAGVMGVIFPFVSTAELARQAVAACKYPPAGRRGSGAGLAVSVWPEAANFYDMSDRNVVVVAMIEEAQAVENIDSIAATPGIDALFLGTSDLSFSLGLRGEQDHPRLEEAIEKVLAAARRHNVPVGRPAHTAEDIHEYTRRGYRLFQSQTDLGLLALGARELLRPPGAGHAR